MTDADTQRTEISEHWERAARGWGRRAQRVRDWGMPVSVWMIEHLELQPGERVLDLAAGPGDTGFLAAELIAPGGTLVSSDASPAMLEVARDRAQMLGIDNVEFKQLELEWIDLPTASVDAVLCRWGIMLIVDPAAALREIRRVLRPGGRAALAVWAPPADNPWATIPTEALVVFGHAELPDRSAPGMFALAPEGRLSEVLEEAGFVDVMVEPVDLVRQYPSALEYVAETLDLTLSFAEVYERLDETEQAEVEWEIARRSEPYTAPDGSLRLPGVSLVALAAA
jgi:ubiquinone/menaquinone biosynthesis C-methylase UbiE